MTLEQIAEYEIYSSFWAVYISWDWGQIMAAKYYVWKSRIKFNRYVKVMEAGI